MHAFDFRKEKKMAFSHIAQKVKSADRKVVVLSAIIAAAALFGAVSLTFGKTKTEAGRALAQPPLSVNAITVAPETVDSVVSAAGTLNSRSTSVLSSKVMGKVTTLTVNEGDFVHKGAVLLRIESGEISAQAYQARAAYDNAKLQYERIKTLFAENAATQMEMDQATLGLASAKAGLNAAKAMESYTTITAPIDGRIVEKRINLGEMAMPGQPIIKIEDNRHLRLETTVREQDLRYIETGMPVTVRIDALPDTTIKARVAMVVPASDMRTHSFVVKIDVPEHRGLITGMYGRALFRTGTRQALLVPRTALVDLSGITGVYIVSPEGSAVFQMIQPGEVRGDRVEAMTGLKDGDRVIVNQKNAEIEGRPVVVAEK
jgi:RND family efflux transporter MFP subunit